MAVTPPFDRIVKLPAQGVDIIQQQFNRLIDDTLEKIKKSIQDIVKLPAGIDCNDPRVKSVKETLGIIQNNLQKIQDNLPRIQEIVSLVATVIQTASAIKNAIAVIQLSNFATAGLYIAQISQQLQDELIANAIQAIIPLQSLPEQSISKLQSLVPSLQNAISKLGSVCNEDIDITIPNITDNTDQVNFPAGFDYNDLLPSEFYREINVSEADLIQRSDNLRKLVEQQQNLLESLREAPSQVYKQAGIPPNDLGKSGDFYVDTQNNIAYGPKPSDTEWGGPLN
jgi:hypothetical protein